MTLPKARGDREYQVFVECPTGEIRKRVEAKITASQYPLETITSGLTGAIKMTTLSVGDVALPLPATPLTSRKSLVINNLDQDETLYIGDSGVTADRVIGTTAGQEVGPGESIQIDAGPTLLVYGRVETGKSIIVKVMEIS
jgi:hypothetical protein